ncbi:hypothetical protein [Lysinibacillus sphaericus]|uniref:hypothetical protein n=1 Tax=Lysinibacillus sphaericus TaxID=1421 RepID=UPI003CFFA944
MNSVLQEQKRVKSEMEIMKERISRLEEETCQRYKPKHQKTCIQEIVSAAQLAGGSL